MRRRLERRVRHSRHHHAYHYRNHTPRYSRHAYSITPDAAYAHDHSHAVVPFHDVQLSFAHARVSARQRAEPARYSIACRALSAVRRVAGSADVEALLMTAPALRDEARR